MKKISLFFYLKLEIFSTLLEALKPCIQNTENNVFNVTNTRTKHSKLISNRKQILIVFIVPFKKDSIPSKRPSWVHKKVVYSFLKNILKKE